MKIEEKIYYIWIGQTGNTPGIGYTENGKMVLLNSAQSERLLMQGLIKKIDTEEDQKKKSTLKGK